MPRELKPNLIRDMSPEEIRDKIVELRHSIFNLRFRNSMKQLDNALELRYQRREIARLTTILAEHQKGIRSLSGVGTRSED